MPNLLVVSMEINGRPAGPTMSSNPVPVNAGGTGIVKSSPVLDFGEYARTTTRSQTIADVINGLGEWWHFLNGTWLLWTNYSPNQITASIAPYLENQDRLIIAPVTTPFEGWLPQEAWEWINQRVTQTPPTF